MFRRLDAVCRRQLGVTPLTNTVGFLTQSWPPSRREMGNGLNIHKNNKYTCWFSRPKSEASFSKQAWRSCRGNVKFGKTLVRKSRPFKPSTSGNEWHLQGNWSWTIHLTYFFLKNLPLMLVTKFVLCLLCRPKKVEVNDCARGVLFLAQSFIEVVQLCRNGSQRVTGSYSGVSSRYLPKNWLPLKPPGEHRWHVVKPSSMGKNNAYVLWNQKDIQIIRNS